MSRTETREKRKDLRQEVGSRRNRGEVGCGRLPASCGDVWEGKRKVGRFSGHKEDI